MISPNGNINEIIFHTSIILMDPVFGILELSKYELIDSRVIFSRWILFLATYVGSLNIVDITRRPVKLIITTTSKISSV